MMSKSELIQKIADELSLAKKDVKAVSSCWRPLATRK